MNLREAAQQALEALEETTSLCINYKSVEENDGYQFTEAKAVIEMGKNAITALRVVIAEAAINETETVEPVAYVAGYYNGQLIVNFMDTAVILPPGMALYRAPNEWVGLTDDEIWEISQNNANECEYVRAIEVKLKEKNL
jgi:hypothetical protein